MDELLKKIDEENDKDVKEMRKLLKEFKKQLKDLKETLEEVEEDDGMDLDEFKKTREKDIKIFEERREETKKMTNKILDKSEVMFMAIGDGGCYATGRTDDKINLVANLINMLKKDGKVPKEIFESILDQVYEEEE